MAQTAGKDVEVYDLPSGWHVDQAILHDSERVVVILFGKPDEIDVMVQTEMLRKIAPDVVNFAVLYTCDNSQVKDFNKMYELYDPCTLMFFWRNKHVMIDTGTGNNNKVNFLVRNKQELIDMIEVVYRGAKKGRGLVVAVNDYSTRHEY
ncbi:Dimethyladenosine transferase [Sporothrix eucalyptigena]|uniref:Spliceosomal protein DIB1 n=1 Tax=Sporothrix eucalyptigena TaxID=1812306 RepID=A0ABP0CCE5_9PEZI